MLGEPGYKATPQEVKAFFEADGGAKVSASEIMALKKDRYTKENLPDYDHVAFAIGNGSLTY
jgi:hypothetical protein